MRRADIWIGGALLAVMIAVAVLSPYLANADPRALSPGSRLLAPSASHWFGTDQLGRDLFARVIWGARVSLFVGIAVAVLSSVVGTAVGMLSASSRRLDAVVMRVMDGVMSIPAILLAIALMAVAGGSVLNVIVAVTVVEIPRVARLIRGIVLSLREQPYVEAAVAAGTSRPMIVIRHLLPGIVAPLTVQATFIWATAMILEAALSFIGAGTPPSTPSWGNILADARALWQLRPTLIFFPASFLFVTLLAVNMLGDGLRDILDPLQNQEG
jgi:peptide/nickel transport system permease protein